jgi:ADP-dependent phosphofructokinase/glucokinase
MIKVKGKKQFVAANGSHLSNKDAVTIGKTLDRLALKHGGLVKADHVLAEAKRQASPIHKFFEWNKDKAFEKYLLERAYFLIRSVHVIIKSKGKSPESIRAVHFVKDANGNSGYASLESVAKSEAFSDYLVKKAKSDLEIWKHKYQSLQELTEFGVVFSAIEVLTREEAASASAAE